MVELVALVRRRPDVDVEEFHRHWREQHGPLVAKTLAPWLRRYEQYHRLSFEGSGSADYDGAAVLQFDSVAALGECLGSDVYRDVIAPDEEKFLQRDEIVWLVADEPERFV